MLQKVRILFSRIGVDAAIAFTLVTRALQAGGGVISILFIAKFLTADEQGYYYTFASLIAIQVFFELGLSSIITQYTAHEFAHLKWTEDNYLNLTGPDYNKSRLASLLQFCVKWFGIISIALFFLLALVGFYFFNHYGKIASISWQGPWIVLCIATALNLFIDPILAFFDGIGEVKDMAKVRAVQKVAYISFLFLFFFAGFNLYSAALASTLSILINYFQIFFSKRKAILITIWRYKQEWVINYSKELFPYQWRIALSWVSGYFMFQLFSPVIFATDGAKVAGQMGMTLQVLNGISGLSMSWINTKIPVLSNYIAVKNYSALDNLFNKTLKNLMVVNGFLSLIFVLIVYILKLNYWPYEDRFLTIVPTTALTVSTFLYQLIFSWAVYLRCHKREPLLIYSVTMAILTLLATFLLGNKYGVVGITLGYFSLTLFISLPWVGHVFHQKKLLWHK